MSIYRVWMRSRNSLNVTADFRLQKIFMSQNSISSNCSIMYLNIKSESVSIGTCNYLRLHVLLFLSNVVRQINSRIFKLNTKEVYV